MINCLVIDDNPHDRSLIRFCAEQIDKNINVLEADNGNEGCALASTTKPDITIVDLRMPGMDGFETINCIRVKTGSSGIDYVVLSGSDDKRERERAVEMGARGYFTKPDNLVEYRKVVEKINELRQRR